jgi:hypothetical protein
MIPANLVTEEQILTASTVALVDSGDSAVLLKGRAAATPRELAPKSVRVLEIDVAGLTERDVDAIRRRVHSLRGSAAKQAAAVNVLFD